MPRTLAFAALVSFVSGQAAPACAQPEDHRFVGTILFPNPDGGPGAYGATWAKTPSATEVRAALPSSVDTEGNTVWSCHVRPDGSLLNCSIEAVWPRDARYEAAARSLLGRFQLQASDAAAAQRNNATVDFDIDFGGPGLKSPSDLNGCPPPICQAVPPPPPPPQ